MKNKKTIIIEEQECTRCGFTWFPRVEKPNQCPRCKNPNWDKDKVTPKYMEGEK